MTLPAPGGSSSWRMARTATWMAALLVFGMEASPAMAYMQIEGLSANQAAVSPLYDRFDNDPSFIGNSFSLSGVGQVFMPNGQSIGQWATMISPSYFISANHQHPGATPTGDAVWNASDPNSQFTIRFYDTNNANGGFEDYTNNPADASHFSVVGEIGNGDLWIGKLSTPVSSQVAKYPILANAGGPTYTSSTNYYNTNPIIYTVGVGTGGQVYSGPNGTSVRLGRNQIDFKPIGSGQLQSVFDGTSDIGGTLAGQNFRWFYGNNPGIGYSNLDLGADESMVNGGDSGAPNFITLSPGNTMPSVVGINYYEINNSNNVGIGSGSTFVPGYIAKGQPTQFSMATLESAMYGSGEQPSLVFSDPTMSLGDFNLDGTVTTADVQAMLTALADPNAFESLHGISASYFSVMADVNQDGVVNNADVQALISMIANGGAGGSLTVVPEPAAGILLLLGAWPIWRFARRRRAPAHVSS
jgi:Dockerin type I domain